MSKQLSGFTAFDGVPGVYCAERGTLRCTAIRLKGGGLCLYSPVSGLNAKALDSLRDFGEVAVLFAPNHYHNKAVAEYAKAFPKARLVCSQGARPRLEKIIGLEFSGLDVLGAGLPDGAALVEPDGLKTGEVWVRIEAEGGAVWIVTDAFGAAAATEGSFAEALEIVGTFPRYGVGDLPAYRTWVAEQIARDRPAVLIPCHGAPSRGDGLGGKLQDLMDTRF